MSNDVNHPQHYGGNIRHETYKCLHAWGLEKDALLWQVGKYISRAGKKATTTAILDLQKAAWYLNKKIERLERRAKRRK